MLGLILARAGVDVLVLEKHQDFFRDFRGDTIHPSTLELMHELGLLEDLLRQPHHAIRGVEAHFGDRVLHLADLSHLPAHCKFIALMPQWDFLNFLSSHAQQFPQFRLHMRTEVTDLLLENGKVVGVKAHTPEGTLEVRAELVVGMAGVRLCASAPVWKWLTWARPLMCCGLALRKQMVIRRRLLVTLAPGNSWS